MTDLILHLLCIHVLLHFLAKNWLGYKDAISLEEATPPTEQKKSLQLSDVRKELEKYAIEQKMKQENTADTYGGDANEF